MDGYRLKEKLKDFVVFCCPAVGGQSIDEIATILVFFPNFKSPKIIIRFLFIYFCYVAYMIDGFGLTFIDTLLLPVPRDSLGPLNYAVHLMYGSVFADLMYNRSYLVYQHLKYGRANIKWFNLIKDVDKKGYPTLFAITHYFYVELYVSCTILYNATSVIKLCFERALLIDIIANCFWMISNTLIMRFVVVDIPTLNVMAVTCYLKVREKYKVLNRIVQEADEEIDRRIIFKIIAQYYIVLETIKNANKLVKFLMFGVNLLLVPFISSLVIITLSNTETWVQTAMQLMLFAPASVYSIRGIILTSVLAKVDNESKTLYKAISSRIARGHIKSLSSKYLLKRIQEDLSCYRNHLLMREYAGSVTQMDVFEFVTGVMQFTMLFIEFTRSM